MFLFVRPLSSSLSLECMSSRSHSIAWYILFFLVFWAGREFLFLFSCQYVLLIHSSAATAGDSEAGEEEATYTTWPVENSGGGRGWWRKTDRQTKRRLGWLTCLLLHLSLGRDSCQLLLLSDLDTTYTQCHILDLGIIVVVLIGGRDMVVLSSWECVMLLAHVHPWLQVAGRGVVLDISSSSS